MNALQLLKKDHATVKELFSQFEKADDRPVAEVHGRYAALELVAPLGLFKDPALIPVVYSGLLERQDRLLRPPLDEHERGQ
jgi:hypothetical protein